jgi:hypothetical protein
MLRRLVMMARIKRLMASNCEYSLDGVVLHSLGQNGKAEQGSKQSREQIRHACREEVEVRAEKQAGRQAGRQVGRQGGVQQA